MTENYQKNKKIINIQIECDINKPDVTPESILEIIEISHPKDTYKVKEMIAPSGIAVDIESIKYIPKDHNEDGSINYFTLGELMDKFKTEHVFIYNSHDKNGRKVYNAPTYLGSSEKIIKIKDVAYEKIIKYFKNKTTYSLVFGWKIKKVFRCKKYDLQWSGKPFLSRVILASNMNGKYLKNTLVTRYLLVREHINDNETITYTQINGKKHIVSNKK